MAQPRGYSRPDDIDAETVAAQRVLIISADMGGGHNATAAALEEAARELWPASEIRRLDMLDVLGFGFGSLFRRIYVSNVETTPWLYEFFYSSLWRHRWFARASKRFTGSWCARRLVDHIEKFDPSVIVSTYPLATSGLAWLRRHRGLAVPCAAWVSDFAPHPFWVYRDIDMNFVMHDVARAHALAAEPGAMVDVSSPPVIASFMPGDRFAARSDLGLRTDAFVVLVTCGTYAFGDVVASVRALLEASPCVQVVAACGRNTVSLARLEGLGVPPERLVPLGWTDRMADYTRAADVVLTNAGGATALEALKTCRPVVICRPIAAHGAANAQLMVVSGLADVCANEERLVDYIRAAVADREGLDALERRAVEHTNTRSLSSALAGLIARREHPAAPERPWPMRPADAFFAHVASDDVRQEIGAVLELDPIAPGVSLDAETLRAVLAERVSGLPPLRRRLVRRPRLGWSVDGDVDVDDHVHEHVVLLDVDDAEISDVINDVVDGFWTAPMPADRPAWQMLLVRGGSQGRAVLAVKMLHAHGDGVSALGLLDRLLTPASDDRLVERGGRPGPVARRTAAQALRRSGVSVRGLWSLATRGRPPRHALNSRPIGSPARSFVGVPLPADALRDTARALHAQPHELAFSVIADGIGRMLEDMGLLRNPPILRAMVPIAMRPPRLDRIVGNWTGAAALDLPVGPMPPAQRLAAVQKELRRRIGRGEPQAAQVVMEIAGALPSPVHAWFARLVYNRRFFSTIITYMPGARGPRWCAGARVRAMYPVLPLTEGVPLTVGAVAAGATVGVGVFFDPSLKLDRDDVAASVILAFEAARVAGSSGDSSGVAAG